ADRGQPRRQRDRDQPRQQRAREAREAGQVDGAAAQQRASERCRRQDVAEVEGGQVRERTEQRERETDQRERDQRQGHGRGEQGDDAGSEQAEEARRRRHAGAEEPGQERVERDTEDQGGGYAEAGPEPGPGLPESVAFAGGRRDVAGPVDRGPRRDLEIALARDARAEVAADVGAPAEAHPPRARRVQVAAETAEQLDLVGSAVEGAADPPLDARALAEPDRVAADASLRALGERLGEGVAAAGDRTVDAQPLARGVEAPADAAAHLELARPGEYVSGDLAGGRHVLRRGEEIAVDAPLDAHVVAGG